MGDLRDVLLDGAEAKRRLFAGEDFAGEFGRAIAGRVRRRRTARAAGVGGASVLGVGALAVGAMHLPGLSGGLGVTPAGGMVVCTTAGAEQGWASLTSSEEADHAADFGDWGVSVQYDFPELTIADSRSDGALTIVSLEHGPAVIEDGGKAALRQHDDGTYTIPLPDDRVVTLRVIPYEPPTGVEDITLEYRSPTLEVAVGASQAPVVTCVTESPEPRPPSVSATPEPSVTPSTRVSGEPVTSPFQCGFEFPAKERGSEGFGVTAVVTTDADIRELFSEWYGDQAPTTEVGDGGATAYRATLISGPLDGVEVTAADPAGLRNDVLPTAVGLSFVAVKDSVVIGTIPAKTNNATGLVVDRDGSGAPLEAFLWNLDGMQPCGASSLDGAQIYAVAGQGAHDSVGYAWFSVSE